ncbi:hypothetical protein C8R43DRAFT_1120829 [Mycena crocata]|nr:hypothetical protein C8R43DRAFT_1120829 [Mycena crocata]
MSSAKTRLTIPDNPRPLENANGSRAAYSTRLNFHRICLEVDENGNVITDLSVQTKELASLPNRNWCANNSPSATRFRICTATRRLGSRTQREYPLTEEELYQGTARPPTFSQSSSHQCSICLNILSHPVKSGCNHVHCYVCIRQWLEHSWQCPECREQLTAQPKPDTKKATAIANDHPSAVTYSWAGLQFPVPVYDDSD